MRTSLVLSILVATAFPHARAQTPNDTLDVHPRSYPSYSRGLPVLIPTVAGATAGAYFGSFLHLTTSGFTASQPMLPIYFAGGMAVGSLACTGAQATRYGRSFYERYVNCVMEPLRWFNANPRDRMYLTELVSCSREGLVARLGSPSGRFEQRRFISKNGELKSIRLIEEDDLGRSTGTTIVLTVDAAADVIQAGRSEGDHRTPSTLTAIQLRGLDALLADHATYVELCARPHGPENRHPRGYDRQTPQQLRQHAL